MCYNRYNMRYGIPYEGSKNSIAQWIVDNLPKSETLVDCDVPYRSTDCGHYEGFDWERFYDWVRAYPQPIYISEYTMPDDFVRVAAKVKRNLLSARHKNEIEGIWLHKKWADAHRVTTLFAE